MKFVESFHENNKLITNLVIMKAEQVVGVVGMSTMTVRPGDTSVAQGVNDLPVVSTNNVLSLMESACSASIIEFLDFGETTITEKFTLEFSGSVGVGSEIHATARCLSFENNILIFEVQVNQHARLIASGQVTRKFVERVSFMARAAAETMVAERPQSSVS
jgi:predicted thioesterase